MGPGPKLNTRSDISRIFWLNWDELPIGMGQILILKCFPTMSFMTKRGRPEKWNQQLQTSSMSWWALRKENTCHLVAIRLQQLPMVNPEETLRTWDHRPSDGWRTYQENVCYQPWLLHLSIHGKVLKSVTWNSASWISSSVFLSWQQQRLYRNKQKEEKSNI